MRQPIRDGILIVHFNVENTADVLSIGCQFLMGSAFLMTIDTTSQIVA
jgi:hypothetical protein